MRTLVRMVAVAASVVIVLSFAMFAADQGARGRDEQLQKLQEQIAPPAPGAAAERQREARNSTFRELVDDANDFLLKPFSGVVTSSNPWVVRGVPAVLGLLAWGFLLALVANLIPQRARTVRDWRTGQPI